MNEHTCILKIFVLADLRIRNLCEDAPVGKVKKYERLLHDVILSEQHDRVATALKG
jgi:hypothetical protein